MDSLDKRKALLLEKYWDGETTLAEEKELKTLITPEDEGLYEFFSETSSLQEKSIDLDVPTLVGGSSQPARVFRLNRLLAYAASLLILVTAFFAYGELKNNEPQYAMEETYEDPEEALEQTQAALAFVMSKMNKGQEETVQNVKRMEALDVIIPK